MPTKDGFIPGCSGREQVSHFFPVPGRTVYGRRDCLTVQKRFALRGMVPSPTPNRDHGDPQAFRLRSEGKGDLVRAEGLLLLFRGRLVLVPRSELARAVSLNSAGYNLARAAGPAVGGWVPRQVRRDD